MAFIEWNAAYELGIPSIDTEHRRLVDLINALHEAFNTGQTATVLGKVFEELASYTENHFGHEAALFEDLGYPEGEAHLHMHRVLTDKVAVLRHEHERGKLELSQAVFQFLQGWLIEHIQGADRRYAAFMLERGVV